MAELVVKDPGQVQQDLEEEFPVPKGKPISYGPPVQAVPAAKAAKDQSTAEADAEELAKLQAVMEELEKMGLTSTLPKPEGDPELGDFVVLAKDVEPYSLCYAVITEAGDGRGFLLLRLLLCFFPAAWEEG